MSGIPLGKLPNDERWIPGYEGRYSATRAGEIVSYWQGRRTLKEPTVRPDGTLVVNLTVRGEARQRTVGNFVAAAWLGIEPGWQVGHADGDQANNRADNLVISAAPVTHATGRKHEPRLKRRRRDVGVSVDAVAAMRDAGLTRQEIADRAGCSISTIDRRLRGKEGASANLVASPSAVIALRDAGLTQQEIADRLGCSRGTVGRHLREAGRTSPRHAARDAEIVRAYLAGVPAEDIAAQYQITEKRVYLIAQGAR